MTARPAGVFSPDRRQWNAAAAEGNYRLTLTLGGGPEASSTTVLAETRRLMLEHVAADPGEAIARVIAVNVRSPFLAPPPPNAPGGREVVLNERERGSPDWDGFLSLDFEGGAPAAVSVVAEAADELPTLYLAGDSTVCDQASAPYAGWGQVLPLFLGPDLALANHAASGETLKSFISSHRLAKLLERMREGDYLLIQFGHNDQKREWPQTYVDAGTTFKAYLRVYIAEARARGATPILATPPERRKFGPDGRIENSHGPYPQAVRELAAEEGLALVDLEAASRAIYEALGPELSRLALAVPGDETHSSLYGARQLATSVAASLRRSGLPLADSVSAEAGGYDPSRPDPLPVASRPDPPLS
jgi:lysophospholipase L1-like esterase